MSAPVADVMDVAVCCATLANGQPCRYKPRAGQCMCGIHGRPALSAGNGGGGGGGGGAAGTSDGDGATERADECSVCLASMARRRTATMECGHKFHTTCLRSWFRNRPLTCPLCRGVCVEGAALLGPRLAPKLQALMRTVPMQPRGFFPAYIIAQLETPRVAKALGLDEASTELLVDLACECFTRPIFFAQVRAMGL